MAHLKARLLALAIIAVFAGLIYFNWHQLHTEGSYSMKLAAFGPVGVVGGLFLLLFPGKGGKPETTRDKVMAVVYTMRWSNGCGRRERDSSGSLRRQGLAPSDSTNQRDGALRIKPRMANCATN